ncbi:hypothetical protein CHARACLAT_030374 [Characodon lateralis]|uniref:Uncharacterized protein n=1 Tax=Characodon lateralis TaxID=208331 RepID=A0ABU7EY34_9TELE|nr:hypothetical protein [Characodon lateralis]
MDHWKKKARRSEKHDDWVMFCQDTLNLVLHLDALRCCNLSKSPSSLKTYSLMEVASRRKRLSAKPQKCSHKGLKNLNPIKDPWCVLDQKDRPMETLPPNFQDLKDLLLTSWSQIQQQTFRYPEKTIRR